MKAQIYRKILCPAKLNLWLKIGPRLSNGYHDLESLMLPLNWGDEMNFSVRPAQELRIHLVQKPDLGFPAEQNLCVRAAQAFAEEFKISFEMQMSLLKRVPMGAGLGGGSSDAATVLKVLAGACGIGKLRKTKDGALRLVDYPQRLHRVATKLGADVPLFLKVESSWCEGIGEKLSSASVDPALGYCLINSPKIPVPTPWAYRALDQNRHDFETEVELPGRPSWLRGERARLEEIYLENDFEALVLKEKPALLKVVRGLAGVGAQAIRMSGSGSAFFGVFPSLLEARKAATRLKVQGFESTAVRALK